MENINTANSVTDFRTKQEVEDIYSNDYAREVYLEGKKHNMKYDYSDITMDNPYTDEKKAALWMMGFQSHNIVEVV